MVTMTLIDDVNFIHLECPSSRYTTYLTYGKQSEKVKQNKNKKKSSWNKVMDE